MINEKYAKKYCCEDVSKIYGYSEAVADKENMWDIHHCLGLVWSKEQLIEMGLYYNQPAERLMFITRSEHKQLHFTLGINNCEIREKLSVSHKGIKPWNTKESGVYDKKSIEKMAEVNRGKQKSEETRKKISKSLKGKPKSEEHIKNMSESLKGRTVWNKGLKGAIKLTEETRKKMSESHKGTTKKGKTVFQYTLNGEFVKEWESFAEITRVLGYDARPIRKCCEGKRQTAYDSLWFFHRL